MGRGLWALFFGYELWAVGYGLSFLAYSPQPLAHSHKSLPFLRAAPYLLVLDG